MNVNAQFDFKSEITKLILEGTELPEVSLEIPSNREMGDFSFPCFRLAKELKKAPVAIAADLSEKIKQKISEKANKQQPSFVSEIKSVGPYINFYVNRAFFAQTVLSRVLQEQKNYGRSDIGAGKCIMMDYSSPNVAKLFHIGHLMTTILGDSLYKMYQFLGYKPFGINYLGDWGTQFGKLIVAYKKWGNEEAIEEKDIEELTRIYVKFHEEAETDKSLEDEARAAFLKMQQGDKEALELWKWFCELSLREYHRIYEKLDIRFDSFDGESFFNDKMMPVVEELRQKGLLIESQGAQIVDLESFNMPPCLILRSDGGTLYPTRDIAAALYRYKTYQFEKALYITALDQSLHFAQFFKVLELMGYDFAQKLVHVPYGMVSVDSGKLSTRKGNMILIEDLLDEAVSKTLKIIEEKNPNLENKEEIAKEVGIGAVKFNDLYNGRIKDVTFSWDRMLNFDGETGPYVQYTHARACGVLQKAGLADKQADCFHSIEYAHLTNDVSLELIKLMQEFPERIIEATNKYEPYLVTRLIVALCTAFNKFYHDYPILTAEEGQKNARLALTYCVKTVIATGLSLLGIKAPEKM